MHSYLDMGIVSAIYKKCNDRQFEAVSEMDLYAILNLHPTSGRLLIKKGEKIRVCYLVHKLYESIAPTARAEWRTAMLEKLSIDVDFYFSKYKEPVSELPSRKSEGFAKSIESIFS